MEEAKSASASGLGIGETNCLRTKFVHYSITFVSTEQRPRWAQNFWVISAFLSFFFFSLNSRNLVDVLSHLDKWRRLKIGIYILLIMHDITEKYSLRLENVLVAMLSSSTYIDYHSSSKILRTSHIEEEHASREKTLSMAINLFSCTKMYIELDSKRQKSAH